MAAIGSTFTTFAISDEGTLSFVVGEARVELPPHPKYEAWDIAGPDKQLVVCLPGGQLAIWE